MKYLQQFENFKSKEECNCPDCGCPDCGCPDCGCPDCGCPDCNCPKDCPDCGSSYANCDCPNNDEDVLEKKELKIKRRTKKSSNKDLTPSQQNLPPALRRAILRRNKD